MPATLIKNGRVILKDRILDGASVLVRGAKIACAGMPRAPAGASVIDARGSYISPGFIDTHIHGGPDDIMRNEVKGGTTSIIVAESCAPAAGIFKRKDALEEFMRRDTLGSAVLGFRMEGPFISKNKAGAQDSRYIKRPDKKELGAIIGRCAPILKMMTVAPELEGALPAIRSMVSQGVCASIGHSNASCAQAAGGIRAGISHATHMFNAMRHTTSRDPGVVGAVLSDRNVWAEIILDLIHVHKALFGLLMQAKGPEKVLLVTDSVRACRQKGVRKKDGAYRFADGSLSGSALTMISAVRNAVRCGLPLAGAVRLASYNPTKMLGIHRRKGSIESGKDADIVIFNKDFRVKLTMIGGRIVYRSSSVVIGACSSNVRDNRIHRFQKRPGSSP